MCYYAGKGVQQDHAEAVKWYRKASEQGHAIAQCELGTCYRKGEGVPQNDLEAYVWLSLSAAQGVKDAPWNRTIVAGRLSPEQVIEGKRRVAAFVAMKSSVLSSR